MPRKAMTPLPPIPNNEPITADKQHAQLNSNVKTPTSDKKPLVGDTKDSEQLSTGKAETDEEKIGEIDADADGETDSDTEATDAEMETVTTYNSNTKSTTGRNDALSAAASGVPVSSHGDDPSCLPACLPAGLPAGLPHEPKPYMANGSSQPCRTARATPGTLLYHQHYQFPKSGQSRKSFLPRSLHLNCAQSSFFDQDTSSKSHKSSRSGPHYKFRFRKGSAPRHHILPPSFRQLLQQSRTYHQFRHHKNYQHTYFSSRYSAILSLILHVHSMLSASHANLRIAPKEKNRKRSSSADTGSMDYACQPAGANQGAVLRFLSQTARSHLEEFGVDDDDDDAQTVSSFNTEDKPAEKVEAAEPTEDAQQPEPQEPQEPTADDDDDLSETHLFRVNSVLAKSVHSIAGENNSEAKAAYITDTLRNHLGAAEDDVLLAGMYYVSHRHSRPLLTIQTTRAGL